jgi:hypothetical protein
VNNAEGMHKFKPAYNLLDLVGEVSQIGNLEVYADTCIDGAVLFRMFS